MNKNELTKVQKDIYDSMPLNQWFEPEDLPVKFSNRNSQCHKIVDKGLAESRIKNLKEVINNNAPMYIEFRKLETTNEQQKN